MAYNNKITVVGNLTVDSVLLKQKVIKTRVAISTYKGGDPLYAGVTLFTDNPDMQESALRVLLKGTHVEVSGGLKVNEWQSDAGTPHTEVTINADEIKVISHCFFPLNSSFEKSTKDIKN